MRTKLYIILMFIFLFSCKNEVKNYQTKSELIYEEIIYKYISQNYDIKFTGKQNILLVPCTGCVGCDIFVLNKVKLLGNMGLKIIICSTDKTNNFYTDFIDLKDIYWDTNSVMGKYLFGNGYPAIYQFENKQLSNYVILSPNIKDSILDNWMK